MVGKGTQVQVVAIPLHRLEMVRYGQMMVAAPIHRPIGLLPTAGADAARDKPTTLTMAVGMGTITATTTVMAAIMETVTVTATNPTKTIIKI